MTPAEIERVVAGEHADPHSVLGAHPVDGGTAVRAFRPAATSVRVLPMRGEPVDLEPAHAAGVFEAVLPAKRSLRSYRLEVGYPDVPPVVVRDAYSFAPSLGELDLHLIGEGTHERLYDVLGAHPRTLEETAGVAFACSGARDSRPSSMAAISPFVATASAEETRALGARLGRVLEPGDVIALEGDLGSGKTELVKGIAEGLGVTGNVHSPTFVLHHRYAGRIPLEHYDLYRLAGSSWIDPGLDEPALVVARLGPGVRVCSG